jgi:hypothetical protein
MALLERVIVSRKTPGDGRLMISAASAARVAALGQVTLERNGERGPARLHEMTCTCAKGGAKGEGHGEHVHHFVESPLLTALVPGSEVALELDERAATLRVARV